MQRRLHSKQPCNCTQLCRQHTSPMHLQTMQAGHMQHISSRLKQSDMLRYCKVRTESCMYLPFGAWPWVGPANKHKGLHKTTCTHVSLPPPPSAMPLPAQLECKQLHCMRPNSILAETSQQTTLQLHTILQTPYPPPNAPAHNAGWTCATTASRLNHSDIARLVDATDSCMYLPLGTWPW